MPSGRLTTSQLYFLSTIKQKLFSNDWMFNFLFLFKLLIGFQFEIIEGIFNEFNI